MSRMHTIDEILETGFQGTERAWFAFAPSRANGRITGGHVVSIRTGEDESDPGLAIDSQSGPFGSSSGEEAMFFLTEASELDEACDELGVNLRALKFQEVSLDLLSGARDVQTEYALALLHGVDARMLDSFADFQSLPAWNAWLTAHER